MSFVLAQALGNEFDDLVLSRLNRKRADPNLRDKFAARPKTSFNVALATSQSRKRPKIESTSLSEVLT
ncbi:hypothetical protein PENARI_c012G05346 [Penicillium arizonense]|uniref:Uncharacterized protein n=1 Tax=Penicillium arizonense TaxID=1835702 RepID=A0A1F5LF37_PENAI|nr:hypothetical protein PENARI_c012G05346 [Penicillium arizonense]OGE51755.1 hypothetical protein PENARI_c012G05346 [Penicillium arizonense]